MKPRTARTGLTVLLIAAGIAACGGDSSSNTSGVNSTVTPSDITDVDGSGNTCRMCIDAPPSAKPKHRNRQYVFASRETFSRSILVRGR